jgi:short subunit dehydrogenase-like uncharacterized protein
MAKEHTLIRMARRLDLTHTKVGIQTPMTGPQTRMQERERTRMEGRHPTPTGERQGRLTRIWTNGRSPFSDGGISRRR